MIEYMLGSIITAAALIGGFLMGIKINVAESKSEDGTIKKRVVLTREYKPEQSPYYDPKTGLYKSKKTIVKDDDDD
jgi:hypothetical protein